MARTAALPRPRALIVVLVGLVAVSLIVVVAVLVNHRSTVSDPKTGGSVTYGDGTLVARDTFARQVDNGWGSADLGGAYDADLPDDFSVHDGVGSMVMRPGISHLATVTGAHPRDLEATVEMTLPALPVKGGGLYAAVHVRSDGRYYYRAALKVTADNRAYLSISRFDGSPDQLVTLATSKLAVGRVRAEQIIRLQFRVTGTGPVDLAASVGVGATAAPVWQLTAQDVSASRLVSNGTVALWSYLSSTSAQPKAIDFDNLTVQRLQEISAPGSGSAGANGAVGMTRPAGSSRPPTVEPPVALDVARASRLSGVERTNWQERPSSPRPGATVVGRTRYAIPPNATFVAEAAAEPGNGTLTSPYRAITDAVRAAVDGSTIVIRAGTYRESVILPPEKRLTLQAYPGEAVWLDGSDVIGGWRREGKVWVAPWPYRFDASPTYKQGVADRTDVGWQFVSPRHPMAANPEQVWIQGRAQAQVASLAQVGRGRFYVDQDRAELVIGSVPDRALVEASVLQKAMTVAGADDIVRGIGVRRYATSVWQLGAITVHSARVVVENVVTADNATTGLSVSAKQVTLRRVTAVRNGMMGLHAHRADGLRASELFVSRNNGEQFNQAPAAGGMKITTTNDLLIASSTFSDNRGNGLWIDEECVGVDIVRSLSRANRGQGLMVEISSDVEVVGNRLIGNHSAGLQVLNADRIEIASNTLAGNHRRQLSLRMDGRGAAEHDRDPRVSWRLGESAVYDNIVAAERSTACLICVEDLSYTLVPDRDGIYVDHNLYQRDAGSAGSFSVWAAGQLAAVSLHDLAIHREVTGQDALSTFVVDRVLTGDHNGLTPQGRAVTEGRARPLSAAAAAAVGADGRPVQLGVPEAA